MKFKIAISFMITLMVMIAFWALIYGYTSTNNQLKEEKIEICNAYCNCSITQDCNYTFDYEKVKDCECK